MVACPHIRVVGGPGRCRRFVASAAERGSCRVALSSSACFRCDDAEYRSAPFEPHSIGRKTGPPESGPRSEEHTSELQSLMRIPYAVFCLKKKKNKRRDTRH